MAGEAAAPIEVLGAEAQTHLLGEHPDTNVIGGVLVFEWPNDQSVTELLSRIKRRVLSCLDLPPRVRGRAVKVPDEEYLYVLVDDQPIDIDAHVQLLAADEVVDDERFRELCLVAMEQPLNMNRPLWSVTVIPRIAGDRAAAIVRVHHFIQDGVLGMVTGMSLLVDASADAPLREAPDLTPLPMPSVEQLREAVRDDKHPAEKVIHKHFGVHPKEAVKKIEELAHVYRTEMRVTPSDLLTRVSEDRGIALKAALLEQVKECQDAIGTHASVNDVVVTVLVGALQRLLADQDLAGQRMLVDVPVSLSLQSDGQAGFDKFAAMMVLDVPLDETDPLAILSLIHEQSKERKSTDAWAMAEIMHAASLLPLSSFDKISAKLWARGNLLFSNIPGPRDPLFVAGNKVIQAFGLGQLRGHAALRVIVASYHDQIMWASTYDRRVLNGTELEQAIDESLEALRAASGVTS